MTALSCQTGNGMVIVAMVKSVNVKIVKEGFISVRTKNINKDNALVIPVTCQIDLLGDESFAASVPADFVKTKA